MVFRKLAAFLSLVGAVISANNLFSQSFIEKEVPSQKKQVPYVLKINDPLKKEEVKLKITPAIKYIPGENTGTAYLDISAENGKIASLNELWLISPSYMIPNFELTAGTEGKWKTFEETTFTNARDYFFSKLPGIFAGGLGFSGILEISGKLQEKKEQERRQDLESILDTDENIVSIIKKAEIINENTVSVKIPFEINRKELEVETKDGKFITGTYPSTKTNPADELYAIFSLKVRKEKDISNKFGEAENIGIDWTSLSKENFRYFKLDVPLTNTSPTKLYFKISQKGDIKDNCHALFPIEIDFKKYNQVFGRFDKVMVEGEVYEQFTPPKAIPGEKARYFGCGNERDKVLGNPLIKLVEEKGIWKIKEAYATFHNKTDQGLEDRKIFKFKISESTEEEFLKILKKYGHEPRE